MEFVRIFWPKINYYCLLFVVIYVYRLWHPELVISVCMYLCMCVCMSKYINHIHSLSRIGLKKVRFSYILLMRIHVWSIVSPPNIHRLCVSLINTSCGISTAGYGRFSYSIAFFWEFFIYYYMFETI